MASAVDQRSCYLVEERWEQEEGNLLVERTCWVQLMKYKKQLMINFLINCVYCRAHNLNLNTTQYT